LSDRSLGPRYDASTVDIVRDVPQTPIPGYAAESASELADTIRRLARVLEGKARRVDEYLPQTNVPAATTKVMLQPQFEQYWEIIERVLITGPATPSLATVSGRNTVTNPGAAATILNAGALAAGVQYQVSWAVELEGTVTAADADNMRLTGPGGLSLGAAYPGIVGLYEQNSTVVVGDGSTNLTIKSIAAASGAAAIYGAEISAVPLMPTFVLQLGDRFWNLALPVTGILEFSCGIMLSRVDQRILTSSVAGPWSLELTGRADVRNRE